MQHKIQTYDSLTAEVSKAHEQLEAERAAFATQKQAWQLLIQGLQQQTHQPGQWVSPDASSLTIKSDDSYQVRCPAALHEHARSGSLFEALDSTRLCISAKLASLATSCRSGSVAWLTCIRKCWWNSLSKAAIDQSCLLA